MRNALAAFALLAASALPAGAGTSQDALQGFVDRVLADHLRPAAAEFETTAGTLAERIGALCEAPGDAAVKQVDEAFRATVDAWGDLAFLTIDPLVEDDRQARAFFWPDPRGFTLRQVQAVLAEEDETATTQAGLRQKSVALQGLGALEFLLYGTGAETLDAEPDTYRCRYAHAIGENLHEIGASLSAALAPGSTFSDRLSSPGPDNPLYRDAGEAAEDLIASAGTGIEMIRDRIVRPALGESAARAQPKIAPFWRSGEALGYVGHMLDGMRDMLDAGGIGEIVPADRAWLEGSIDFEFANAAGTLGRIDLPLVEAVGDETGRRDLATLVFSLGNQRDLVAQHLVSSAGLKAGFNALDGD